MGFTISSADDVIVRGNINLLGENADLIVQSDSWVYWEGEANVSGDISLLGGVTLNGTNLGGANNQPGSDMDGVSVYTHAASTLNTTSAGSSITISGGSGRDPLGTYGCRR